mgnify:CR=1 FL=1
MTSNIQLSQIKASAKTAEYYPQWTPALVKSKAINLVDHENLMQELIKSVLREKCAAAAGTLLHKQVTDALAFAIKESSGFFAISDTEFHNNINRFCDKNGFSLDANILNDILDALKNAASSDDLIGLSDALCAQTTPPQKVDDVIAGTLPEPITADVAFKDRMSAKFDDLPKTSHNIKLRKLYIATLDETGEHMRDDITDAEISAPIQKAAEMLRTDDANIVAAATMFMEMYFSLVLEEMEHVQTVVDSKSYKLYAKERKRLGLQ